jgi:hypothetical protein
LRHLRQLETLPRPLKHLLPPRSLLQLLLNLRGQTREFIAYWVTNTLNITLKTEISEMIRNSDINDPHNTEVHRDVWIIVVILYQFRIISVIEGFSSLLLSIRKAVTKLTTTVTAATSIAEDDDVTDDNGQRRW